MSETLKTSLESIKASFLNGDVEGNEFSHKAMIWYEHQLRLLLKGKLNSIAPLIKETVEYRTKKVILGEMLLFGYNPTTSIKKMKYYDRFPLVFPLKLYDDHFLGVNLHFIPFNERAIFLENILKITAGDLESGLALARALKYERIRDSTKYVYGMCAIKKYKLDAIFTITLRIPSDKWKYAINLPVARFYGVGTPIQQTHVHRDSRIKIRKYRNRIQP
jgi:hypothetical protein